MEININNTTIHYQDIGSGLPLVFVHGFPLNLSMWNKQIDFFSQHYRVISLDLRGFGKSLATQGEHSMDLYANDIAALLDSLNVIAPVLVGLSMGGYISLAFCSRYAKWLSGLVLVATRSAADSNEAKANRDKLTNLAKEQGIEPLVELLLPKMLSQKTLSSKPEVVTELKQIMMQSSLDGVVGALQGMKNRMDYTPILEKLSLPTLVVHGKDDILIPPSEAETIANGINESKLELLPDAGHMVNMEQPDLFNEALLSFINSL